MWHPESGEEGFAEVPGRPERRRGAGGGRRWWLSVAEAIQVSAIVSRMSLHGFRWLGIIRPAPRDAMLDRRNHFRAAARLAVAYLLLNSKWDRVGETSAETPLLNPVNLVPNRQIISDIALAVVMPVSFPCF